MQSEKKLTAAQKRLYAPKANRTPITKPVNKPMTPTFNLYTGSFSRQTPKVKSSALNELNDLSQVKKKPDISKKADLILAQKQDALFTWLYTRLAPDDGSNLTYQNFKFEHATSDILVCFMPLMVDLRQENENASEENEAKGLTKQDFVKKMTEIVPSYQKVQFIKAIEAMKAMAQLEEQRDKNLKLPWAMQEAAKGKSNKYRRNFDDFKVDQSILVQEASVKMTPVFSPDRQGAKSRNSTSTLMGTRQPTKRVNTSLLFKYKNNDMDFASELELTSPAVAESSQYLRTETEPRQFATEVSEMNERVPQVTKPGSELSQGNSCQSHPSKNANILSPTSKFTILASTDTLKSLRLKKLGTAPLTNQPKFRKRPITKLY